jgi:selenide,water dikinase
MTDVTGFGLMGHLIELCQGANLSAQLDVEAVPLIDRDVIYDYLSQGSFPGGTTRNFQSYGHHIAPMTEQQKYVLCDPQTSGGLLVSVDPSRVNDFVTAASQVGLTGLRPIGRMITASGHLVHL